MKSKESRNQQFFLHGVVARFYCFLFGHNISNKKKCKMCNTQFRVPKMKNPTKPPIKKTRLPLLENCGLIL